MNDDSNPAPVLGGDDLQLKEQTMTRLNGHTLHGLQLGPATTLQVTRSSNGSSDLRGSSHLELSVRSIVRGPSEAILLQFQNQPGAI